jgi:hypothetical protein
MPGHWLTFLYQGRTGPGRTWVARLSKLAAGSGCASGTGIVGSIAYEYGDSRDRWIRVRWRPDEGEAWEREP